MKAKFEFDLPEETEDYLLYHRAPAYISLVDEFGRWLRNEHKHNGKYTEVYAMWNHLLEEEGLSDD